ARGVAVEEGLWDANDTTDRLARPVYSRGDPLRSPLRRGYGMPRSLNPSLTCIRDPLRSPLRRGYGGRLGQTYVTFLHLYSCYCHNEGRRYTTCASQIT